MSYTKGPWKAEVYADGGFEVTGKGGHSGIEAYVVCSRGKHGMSNETAANARLIAAAPSLLDALQGMVEWRDLIESLPSFPAKGALLDDIDYSRAVIARALGEPQ